MPHNSTDYHPSSPKPASVKVPNAQSGWQSQAGDFGYGFGRLLSPLVQLWNNYWSPPPSQAEIIREKQFTLGVSEAVKHLEKTIELLHKNPRDRHNIKHIAQLAELYQLFLVPAIDGKIQHKQSQQFEHLKTRVALLPQSLQVEVKTLIPLLSSNEQNDSDKPEPTSSDKKEEQHPKKEAAKEKEDSIKQVQRRHE